MSVKWARRGGVIAASALMLAVVFGFPAEVLAKCQPGRTNNGTTYFDGWTRYVGSTVGGVYSYIKNYSPWVQPGSMVVAWTMLHVYTQQRDYAQVGWLEYSGGTRYTFTAYDNGSGQIMHLFAPYATNQYTYYTTLYGNVPGKFTFQANGTTLENVPAGFVPNEGQVYGEIKTLASQMPGGYASVERFDDTWIYYSGAWRAFNGSHSPPSSYFGNNVSSTTAIQIWDNACQG